MKKISLIIFLSFSLFLSLRTHAQNWQWGRGNTGGGMDSWPVATDPAGNVFAAGFNFSRYVSVLGYGSAQPAVFGTYTVPLSTATDTGFQCILTKYDASGNFLWARATQNGDTYLMNIATDKRGNSFLFGTINSASVHIGSITLTNSVYPNIQYFIAKYDPAGNVVWAKNAGGAQGTFVGIASFVGTNTCVLGTGGIATDDTGNIYITANYSAPSVTVGPYTLTNTDPSGSTEDILVAKYDSSGNVVWATSSGGSQNDDAYGLTVAPNGSVYIAGIIQSPSVTFGPSTIMDASGGVGNAFIARYSNSGTPVWANSSGGVGGEFAVGVSADATNNVYLTGGLLDPSISFSGTTITNPASGTSVLYLVKFDPSNNVSWYKTIFDPTGEGVWGYAISMSPCNSIWVSGSFTNEVSMDGNILMAPAASGGFGDPVFIAGYSAAGVYAGSATLASGADDQNGIACDVAGNVYMCADYFTDPFNIGSDVLAELDSSDELQYVGKFTPLNTLVPDTTYSHHDTAVCAGQALVLTAPAGYVSYLWDNGVTGTTLSVDSLGTYWVIGTGTCAATFTIDTFHITGTSTDTAYARQDTSICIGSTVSLAAPAGYVQYMWYNGTTGATLSVNDTGIYWVTAFKNCSTPLLIDSFVVTNNNLNLTFSLGDDTATCAPLTLSVSLTGVSYLWQNGTTGSTYTVTQPGTYYVTVSKDGCSNADTINVSVNNVSQNLKDTTLCSELFLQYTLYANVPAGATALWSTGSTQPSIIVKDTGRYWVTVTDAGCTGTDSMVLTTELCNCEAFLPSAFTPNADNLNDTYKPVFEYGCVITGYSFSIYNRWGQQVFTSTDPAAAWDGKLLGVRAEMGAYMYYLKYNAGLNNTAYSMKGDVTLIR